MPCGKPTCSCHPYLPRRCTCRATSGCCATSTSPQCCTTGCGWAASTARAERRWAPAAESCPSLRCASPDYDGHARYPCSRHCTSLRLIRPPLSRPLGPLIELLSCCSPSHTAQACHTLLSPRTLRPRHVRSILGSMPATHFMLPPQSCIPPDKPSSALARKACVTLHLPSKRCQEETSRTLAVAACHQRHRARQTSEAFALLRHRPAAPLHAAQNPGGKLDTSPCSSTDCPP